MKYIETLREGEKLGDIYLCKSRQSALTKSGKSYENVILQDKTGTLPRSGIRVHLESAILTLWFMSMWWAM